MCPIFHLYTSLNVNKVRSFGKMKNKSSCCAGLGQTNLGHTHTEQTCVTQWVYHI